MPGGLPKSPMNIRTTILLVLAGVSSLLLASCNTVQGFGQDIERTGQGLENASQGRDW